MKIYKNIYEQIIALENLFSAWDEFKSDKKNRADVQEFGERIEENIFALHHDLKVGRYKHGEYKGFWIKDPRPRHIHKATVRDRILHHAIFNIFNPIFEPTFIAQSFSCRIDKGTHKGVKALADAIRSVGANGYKQAFALKCDVRKFFDTIDHRILLGILARKIKDEDAMRLMNEIVESFSTKHSTVFALKGVPIGNLTSQLFANIYMNELDQFMKHELRVKNYLRYTDDFVVVSEDKNYLEGLLPLIARFLKEALALDLHPNKVEIRNVNQGIDFLGYVVLPHHRQLRTQTKKRIVRKLFQRVGECRNGIISKESVEQSLQSYLGVLSHANAYNLSNDLINQYWFRLTE